MMGVDHYHFHPTPLNVSSLLLSLHMVTKSMRQFATYMAESHLLDWQLAKSTVQYFTHNLLVHLYPLPRIFLFLPPFTSIFLCIRFNQATTFWCSLRHTGTIVNFSYILLNIRVHNLALFAFSEEPHTVVGVGCGTNFWSVWRLLLRSTPRLSMRILRCWCLGPHTNIDKSVPSKPCFSSPMFASIVLLSPLHSFPSPCYVMFVGKAGPSLQRSVHITSKWIMYEKGKPLGIVADPVNLYHVGCGVIDLRHAVVRDIPGFFFYVSAFFLYVGNCQGWTGLGGWRFPCQSFWLTATILVTFGWCFWCFGYRFCANWVKMIVQVVAKLKSLDSTRKYSIVKVQGWWWCWKGVVFRNKANMGEFEG